MLERKIPLPHSSFKDKDQLVLVQSQGGHHSLKQKIFIFGGGRLKRRCGKNHAQDIHPVVLWIKYGHPIARRGVGTFVVEMCIRTQVQMNRVGREKKTKVTDKEFFREICIV